MKLGDEVQFAPCMGCTSGKILKIFVRAATVLMSNNVRMVFQLSQLSPKEER